MDKVKVGDKIKIINMEGNKLEIMFDKYGHKKLHKDYVNSAE